jgi:hypothetical protein
VTTALDRTIAPRSRAEGLTRVLARAGGLIELPDRIVIVMCEIFMVGATLAAFRVMFWWLFVPALAAVVILTWRFLPQPIAKTKKHRTGAIIAVAFALVWFLVQIPLASQYLVATRDPGIYMIVGAIIAHTGGSPLNIDGARHLATLVPGLTDALGPFAPGKLGDIRLQGSNGVPAMIAIGYWLFGVQGAIQVNLVIGAVGLISVYALARRFMGPYWALAPMLVLSVAMPYIYFARTSYTEMMATLLILACSAWVVSAFNTRRLSDFVIAGALAGASGLTRIDGALELAGALAGLLLVVVGVGRTPADTGLRRNVLGFAVAGTVLLAIGIGDLEYNNARYVHNLGSESRQLWAATAAILVVLVIACLSPLGVRRFELRTWSRRIAIIITAGIAALFVFWLSRPWWMIDHHFKPGPFQLAIAALQAQDGLPNDPSRGYSEYSVWWFAWYFGWAFLALAIVGLCFWVFWAITRRNAAHVVLLAMAALAALLYLNQIKITPDQIFAFRRVLPVITPTLVFSAVFAVRWLWKSRRPWLRRASIVAMVAVAIGTFIPWGQIMFIVEGGGQAAEIEQICTAIGTDKTVVFVTEDAPPNYSATVASVCGTQVVSVDSAETLDWKKVAASATGPVAVVSFDSHVVPWVRTPTTSTKTSEIRMWTEHLLMPPRTATISVRSVDVGHLGADGRVTFVPSRGH